MLQETLHQLRVAALALLLFTLLTGALYPALVTAIAQAAFPRRANGSLIVKEGKAVGSDLIGQPFSDPKYFWGRLSATSPKPYDAASSSGSNLGPTNPALLDNVKARVKALQDADPENTAPIPVDLVTASGSGLDPHISPAAADYQVGRVAKARKLSVEQVRASVQANTAGRDLQLFGDPIVNVLKLNLALDAAARVGAR
ncbi:MAG TPA: potassium-transporting ATPase subunit KdpC [Planctomycetota bacterium]|jgi:K+-transporting ATPase ATPase C chain